MILLYHWGMCRLSENSMVKFKEMCVRSWVNAFCSISVETVGSQKMPLRKVILLSLWKVRIPWYNTTNVSEKLVESFLFNLCGNCGLSKNGSVESNAFYLCGKCGFSEDSLIKYNKCLWDAGWKLSVPSRWRVLAFRKCLNTMPLKWCFYFCGKCGISEESLIKCKQMSMRGWVKAFCSISVETAGSQKMPWWKVILLSTSVESADS